MKPGEYLASKYRLERVLGSGAMGEVWAAVNEGTGRPVAIKLLHSPTPELRVRMLREARVIGTLKHKNIVDIYDVGETSGGDPFLVMEQLVGETLGDRLEWVEHLPPATVIEIGLAIASALRVAHANGVVHRDLKPANIFLHRDPEGEGEIVKVVDFGVSKLLHNAGATASGGLVGSPAYMSPEQAEEGHVDPRSDLWSLGVVLFLMLTGRRPFASSSPYLVISQIVAAPIPSIRELMPGLSPSLIEAVERCLTRDLKARIASADELIRLLGASVEVDAAETNETTKVEQMALSTGPTTKALPVARRRPEPEILRTIVSASGRRRGRGPSNAVVAFIACGSALALFAFFVVLLRRPSPATSAASAVRWELPEATAAAVVPISMGEPAGTSPSAAPVETAPSAPSTSTTVDPVSVVPTASARAPLFGGPRPKAASRTHPDGTNRLPLP